MVSISTLFHPVTLTLWVIPIAIGLGLAITWISNRIILGVLAQLVVQIGFDVWFWRYFYEKGTYADHASSFDNILLYAFFSGLTGVLSWVLLQRKKKKIPHA
ncbi:hypothetical protein [Bacillus sp. REN10]|uniref:hypothetical protein n=1 Tax=Bacillus sp. REN10 TaxID=2782541 RepID=UPI00193B6278|nr:hypothetical protein [Bacillus sp. REN10]